MNLEELLDRAGTTDVPTDEVLAHVGASLETAARADIARRALLVRRRRAARFGTAGVGVAVAAAVVGVIAFQPGHTAAPAAGSHSNGPVSPKFTTVAQVVNAAAAATPNVDPTASPYWKVTTGTTCGGSKGAYPCQFTMWVGNGRPGITPVDNDGYVQTCDGVGTIDGKTMSWQDINARTWTDKQLSTLAAGEDANISGGTVTSFDVMKNALGLMTYTPVSSTIRKQLWKEMATVPGAKLEGRHRDALGRTGWLLVFTGDNGGGQSVGQSILVDTNTGMALEQSDWVVGKPKNVTTVVSAGPVESAPAPTSHLRSMCGPLPRIS